MTGIPRKFQRAAKIAVETFQKSKGSEPVNTDTEGVKESVRINGLSVLSGLNLEKMKGLSFPRDKANCPS